MYYKYYLQLHIYIQVAIDSSHMWLFFSPLSSLSLGENRDELKPRSNIFHTSCRDSSVPTDDSRAWGDPECRTGPSGWFGCGGVFSLLPTNLRKKEVTFTQYKLIYTAIWSCSTLLLAGGSHGLTNLCLSELSLSESRGWTTIGFLLFWSLWAYCSSYE